MAKSDTEKTTTFRTTHDLYEQVNQRCKSIPGGMSFNAYTNMALVNSLKEPVENIIPKDKTKEVTIASKTMLRLMQPHVINQLIRKYKYSYKEANSIVFKSIAYDQIDVIALQALNDVITSFEAT